MVRHYNFKMSGGPLDGETLHMSFRSEPGQILNIVYRSGMYIIEAYDREDVYMRWIDTTNA